MALTHALSTAYLPRCLVFTYTWLTHSPHYLPIKLLELNSLA